MGEVVEREIPHTGKNIKVCTWSESIVYAVKGFSCLFFSLLFFSVVLFSNLWASRRFTYGG